MLKKVQKIFLLMSVISLIFSIVFSYVPSNYGSSNHSIFKVFFWSISDDVWHIYGVKFFLIFQAISILLFFGIAIYIGFKVLPAQLSENEKKEAIASPYDSFNRLIFSKTLLGNVYAAKNTIFDLRRLNPLFVADVYLIHLKISGKKNGLIFLFIFTFIVPFFVDISPKTAIAQLVLNFVFLNLSSFLIYDVALLIFSKHFIKGK